MPGFDANYISVSDVAIGMNGFYNKASEIRLPITRLMARERCGLTITGGRGTITVDSVGLGIRDLNIRTTSSKIFADADVPFALMAMNPDAKTSVLADADIAPSDIGCPSPSLNGYLRALPSKRPAKLQLKADGSLSAMQIASLKVNVPQVFDLVAKGSVRNPLDIKENERQCGLRRRPFRAEDSRQAPRRHRLRHTGIVAQRVGRGRPADVCRRLPASVRGRRRRRETDACRSLRKAMRQSMDIKGLQAGRFLPDMGIGSVTAHITASGAGFNPTKPGAHTLANVSVGSAIYKGHDYRNIGLHAELGNGDFKVNLNSPDPDLDLTLDAYGTVAPDDYTFDIRARINHIDLRTLGLSETLSSGNANIYAQGSASPERWIYDVDLKVDNFDWNMP